MTARLTPDDWIAAALRALARGGLGAVRAEALARNLGVTKGSFYWHFKDVPALLQVLLTDWEDQAIARIDDLAQDGPLEPVARLRALADLATADLDDPAGAFAIEAAIRDWARHDATAAGVQARVDARRQAWLAEGFAAAGLDRPQLRARLFLAGLVGAQHLAPQAPDAYRAQLHLLIDLLLRPLEGD